MYQPAAQRGMTLIAAMLLLLVITILGVGMFRSFGLQEHIAGNTREKQRALRAAEAAEYAAEIALTSNGGANATTGVTCAQGVTTAFQVCSNTLASQATSMSTLPLNIGGQDTEVTYAESGLTVGTNATNIYYKQPGYYISFITGTYNATTGAATNTYTVDAVGWGGTASSIAEVESTYVVNVVYTTQDSASKFINLGGP